MNDMPGMSCRLREKNGGGFDFHSTLHLCWKMPGISCDQRICFSGNRHFEKGKIIPVTHASTRSDTS
jgi:hypothetical protein